MSIRIQPADSVPRSAFIQALNAAYADYYVPIHVSPPFFRQLIRREGVDLAASAVAVTNGEVVGTGLLGVRDGEGWIGGMGVIPEWRRQGIGRRLLRFLLEQADRLNLSRLRLEVIEQNEAALNLYLAMGFTITRELRVMGCSSPQPKPHSFEVTVKRHRPDQLLDCLPDLPGVERPWQRTPASIQTMLVEAQGLAAVDDGISGALIYTGGGVAVGLLDIAACDETTGTALLHHLMRRYPHAHYNYLNVASDDPLLPVLEAAGFSVTVNQYEMDYA